MSALELIDVTAAYGRIQVLHGVSFTVPRGAVVALLGPNGAGKSTLLRAISRFDAQVRSGTMRFDGNDLLRCTTERTVRLGCLHVPEGRRLFTELSVDDNLRLGAFTTSRTRSGLEDGLAAVYDRFPSLAARRRQTAFALSGGEQQMLAIGRALMAKPKLLMLDEPSTGLAPQVVERIFSIVAEFGRTGTAVLLVEQNAYLTLQHASRAYVLEGGTIALSGTAHELRDNARVREIYLGGTA